MTISHDKDEPRKLNMNFSNLLSLKSGFHRRTLAEVLKIYEKISGEKQMQCSILGNGGTTAYVGYYDRGGYQATFPCSTERSSVHNLCSPRRLRFRLPRLDA